MKTTTKRLFITICILFFVSIQGLFALPGVMVKIERIVGAVTEVHPSTKENPWAVICLKVATSSSPENVKDLYSITRKAKNFPVRIENYGRPGKNEVLLVFSDSNLTGSSKVFSKLPTKGDVLRVTGYSIRVTESGSRDFTDPWVDKVEVNPKN